MSKRYSGWKWDFSRMLTRRKADINFLLRGHILNPLWHSRERRRHQRFDAVVGYMEENLKLSLPDIASFRPAAVDNPGPEPERVFTIWLQGEESAPDIVKSCFSQMRKVLGMEVVVLDEKTLFDWIKLPDYVIDGWKSGKMCAAHFSDICRVELLYQHGGVWLDSTDFVISRVPQQIMDCDFFVYMAGQKISSWYGYIQNCFIRAKKGNPLLGLWREAILTQWKRVPKAVDYFQHQVMFKKLVHENSQAAALFKDMPKIDQDPTHSLWFGYGNEPYEEARYKELASVAFFTKTTYKSKMAKSPLPGSIAEYMSSRYKSGTE